MNRQKGFTFLQLLVAMVIVGILAVIALPNYGGDINCDAGPGGKPGPVMRAKQSQMISGILTLQSWAFQYETRYNKYPESLADLGPEAEAMRDPWDNPYQFVAIRTMDGVGKARKDHNMKPINMDYDIYSMGPDGKTATPITSTPGEDDFIIAYDGGYLGFACHFNGSGKNK